MTQYSEVGTTKKKILIFTTGAQFVDQPCRYNITVWYSKWNIDSNLFSEEQE